MCCLRKALRLMHENGCCENIMVSIIVPVYNKKRYLMSCLNSLINQTYKEFEVLLIDDGSTDGSGVICEQFAVLDSRFKVVHQQNRGVSYSRNWGILHAEGEYILFVDADDYVSNNYVAELVRNANKFDMIFAKTRGVTWNEANQGSSFLFETQIGSLKTHLIWQDFSYDIFTLLYFVTGKLYKKDIIKKNRLFFDKKIAYREDGLFNFRYFNYIKSYDWVEGAVYVAVATLEDSLAKQRHNEDNLVLIEEFLMELKRLLSNNIKIHNFYMQSAVFNHLTYTGGGYLKWRKRALLCWKFLKAEYPPCGLKAKLLFAFLKHKLFLPLFAYYHVKY